MPYFSIIIPVYNVASHFCEAKGRVLNYGISKPHKIEPRKWGPSVTNFRR